MVGARGRTLRLSRGSRIGSSCLSLSLSLSRGVFLLELFELFDDLVITLDEDFQSGRAVVDEAFLLANCFHEGVSFVDEDARMGSHLSASARWRCRILEVRICQ